jgi:hypothetical protein
MVSQIEMGKRKRRRKKRKNNYKKVTQKQAQLAMDFQNKPKTKKANENLQLTGRFRVVKSASGHKILVQTLPKGQFVKPTQEQIDYLVRKKLILADTGRMPNAKKG